ncbi:hypothetical protein HN832_02285 [archaeon]|jgi:hypothetical protein|nr:hypothetical protein [archaeon]MBT4373182.1 hypothetical protein [archaeon]MBT4531527.1 hypothetical protein [archaeon]MBT7001295.1 hypothetical protein [archaeon]MBT7282219.1 hypothetical protein [archaeon]
MFEKKMKNLDLHDIALTKLTVFALTLFLITVWPAALTLALSIHWGWFLGVGILAMLRPMYRFYLK